MSSESLLPNRSERDLSLSENFEQHPEPPKQSEIHSNHAVTTRENLAHLRQEIEQVAISAEQTKPAPRPLAHQVPHYADVRLQKATTQQALTHLQHQLPLAKRLLSKAMHQPTVNTLSEIAGQTLSRPSGLLGGGFFALIGSLAYLYFARHIGWQYNYFLFIAFFAAGFVIGLSGELILWVWRRSKA